MNALPFDEPEFLTVRVGAPPGEGERLLLVGRPHAGTVRVRQWTSNSWNTAGEVFDTDPTALLAELERASSARLPVSEEMPAIRRWLTGQG